MVESADIMAFANRFGLASQLFQSLLERRLTPLGLTPPQLSVLAHLAAKRSPLRVTDIASAVQVKQPAVTKMLTKFETLGWITFIASEKDRRSKTAVITEQGGAHLIQVQRSLLPEIGPYLMKWNNDDLARFTENLANFAQFLDELGDLDDPSRKGLSNDKN